MILPLHEQVRARVRDALAQLHGITDADLVIPIEYPPNRTLGDLGTPVAFDLARRLRKAPRAIAQELAGALGPMPGDRARRRRAQRLPQRVSRSAGVPAGAARPRRQRCRRRRARPEKTIVEHTAINPNKAAHIGHLRNSALGDTLVRVLQFRGNPVEVQNYIDDTGVQVADVVVGFQQLEKLDLDDAQADRRDDALRLLLLGPLRARHRVVRRRQGAAEDPRRDAARHRARRRADREPRRVHRRHRRPRAPEDDGAAQHRLPAADVGRRHPAPAVLGARVRGAEADRRGVSCRPRASSPAAG